MLLTGLNQNSSEKISDLQSIVSTLLETVNDKNLALHHLRNTNKLVFHLVSFHKRTIELDWVSITIESWLSLILP